MAFPAWWVEEARQAILAPRRKEQVDENSSRAEQENDLPVASQVADRGTQTRGDPVEGMPKLHSCHQDDEQHEHHGKQKEAEAL
jgi:hypothetical protein